MKLLLLPLPLALLTASWACAAPEPRVLERGAEIYAAKCTICHQATGQGAPPVYPPLANSDWLRADRARAIRVLCEGLEGPITVNGINYVNAMPAQVLDDDEVAAVLTYVTNSWGQSSAPFTVEEVAAARAKSRFKTFAALSAAAAYRPLPKAPDGADVREIAPTPEFCTRLATRGPGEPVYVLAQKGSVYLVDAQAGALQLVMRAADYLGPTPRDLTALGLAAAPDGRLYLITNERISTEVPLVQNEVSIWRVALGPEGLLGKPQLWLRVRYPYGVGPYNHGVSGMAFGHNGKLYVNSGSRTDGGEKGTSPVISQDGETDLTACIWELDPTQDVPKIRVYARGIRNAWGLAFDGESRLFSVSNGPDASTAEEMDWVREGRHFGFPYQFADLPATKGQPYPHTPEPPAGVEFTMPVRNVGPDGGGSSSRAMATFDPHSSPGGLIWCGEDWPLPYRNGFLVTRFGNLLGAPAAPTDVGFDLLSVHLTLAEERWTAETTTVLAALGRPLDIAHVGPGRAWILEYTRPTNFRDRIGWLPGRVIEFSTRVR